MKHTETVYYHEDNVQDIMVIKSWMRNSNFKHIYDLTLLNKEKGIWKADFIMDETQDKLQYIVSGIRQKLDSLGYV